MEHFSYKGGYNVMCIEALATYKQLWVISRAQTNIRKFGLIFVIPLFGYYNRQPKIIRLLFEVVFIGQITQNLTRF